MYKKIIITAVCLVIVAAIFFGGKYLYDTLKYKRIISEIEIRTPDTTQIQDGIYKGSFDAILVSAIVNVTVENHKIVEITIVKHKNERGPDAEAIIEDVITNQSLEVDTVSGATNSSKVILRAIQNALESDTVSSATVNSGEANHP